MSICYYFIYEVIQMTMDKTTWAFVYIVYLTVSDTV